MKCLPIINLALQLSVLISCLARCDEGLLVACQTGLDKTADMSRALARWNSCLKPMGHSVRYRKCDSHKHTLCITTYDCQAGIGVKKKEKSVSKGSGINS
jgi:hypothetical protein